MPAAAARFVPRPLDGSTDRPAEGRLKAHRLPTADGIQVSAAGMIRSGTVSSAAFQEIGNYGDNGGGDQWELGGAERDGLIKQDPLLGGRKGGGGGGGGGLT